LQAVSEAISGTIQCPNGTLTKKGEFRLRADIRRLPEFINGIGATSSNIAAFIEAEIVAWVAQQNAEVVLSNLQSLNVRLRDVFVTADHPLEQEYGVFIESVSITEILPSADVQKTMGMVTESKIIADQLVAFICRTNGIREEDYNEAVREGRITNAMIAEARDRIMSMSGNLEGMTVTRHEIDVRGIPGDAAAAIVGVAEAIAGARRAGGNNQQNRGGRNNRPQGGNQ